MRILYNDFDFIVPSFMKDIKQKQIIQMEIQVFLEGQTLQLNSHVGRCNLSISKVIRVPTIKVSSYKDKVHKSFQGYDSNFCKGYLRMAFIFGYSIQLF